MRPEGYFPRIQTPIKKIIDAFIRKFEKLKLPSGICRHRFLYWWKGFCKQVQIAGLGLEYTLLSFFTLINRNIIILTHSLKQNVMKYDFPIPYLYLPVTGDSGFP